MANCTMNSGAITEHIAGAFIGIRGFRERKPGEGSVPVVGFGII